MTSTTTALTIHVIEGEPRVLDTDLALELGYKRPEDIRPLIVRHITTLESMGRVIRTVRKTSPEGGRPATENRLNRTQALFIVTKAETNKAIEVTVGVVEKFVAYEAGLIQAQPSLPDFTNPALAARAWAEQFEVVPFV